MKRLGTAMGLVCLALLAYLRAVAAQGPDIGPGDGGAALRNPFDPVPVRPTSAPVARPPASEVERTIYGASAPKASNPFPEVASLSKDGKPHGLAALKPSSKDDINKDITVQPSQGPWMISVMSYVGEDAPENARAFVTVLRSKYKLPAFVFNHGSEDRKKEYDRVKEMVDRQKKFCEDNNLPLDKVRIRYTFVPDQCAVLIGGYPSEEAAHRELKRVRELKSKDLEDAGVKLDVGIFARGERDPSKFDFDKVSEAVAIYANPFKRAFLVRNPSIKVERKEGENLLDMTPKEVAQLRKLNNGEPYNLFECKKAFTLAITHFRTPTASEETVVASSAILGTLGIAKKKQRDDYAATNAHTIADNLRKHFKLEAYVLHTRYMSVVTVGGYDAVDDPSLRSMKSLLQERLRIPGIEMFPEPYLMKVPH